MRIARRRRTKRFYSSMPAMQADMKLASVPTNMAFSPRRARSDLRDGASAPMPPICMAIELRLAKTHNAKVAITTASGRIDHVHAGLLYLHTHRPARDRIAGFGNEYLAEHDGRGRGHDDGRQQ